MNPEETLQKLNDFTEEWNRVFKEIECEQEDYWNGLTKEDQLKAFCAVVRRIRKGEIQDKGSYRYVLYDVFQFGVESYAQAQLAGYLELHNCIYDYGHDRKLLEAFCKDQAVEDGNQKIKDFLKYNE